MRAIVRSRTIVIINLLTGVVIAVIVWKKPFPFPEPEFNLVKILLIAQFIFSLGVLFLHTKLTDAPKKF